MLTVNLNKEDSIAILEPHGALSENDFHLVTQIIDPFIEENTKLNGIIIYVKSFPGWDSFSALLTHLKFVNEHHKKISNVAFVTDSIVGKFAERVASHFVKAQVRTFSFDHLESAKEWILTSNAV